MPDSDEKIIEMQELVELPPIDPPPGINPPWDPPINQYPIDPPPGINPPWDPPINQYPIDPPPGINPPIEPAPPWRPPSDEVIRNEGGFHDPRGVWIDAAIHFGDVQPDPNWRMPSDEEIRANAGYLDALGSWINSEIHFRDRNTNSLRKEIKATQSQINEWNQSGQIPDNWATDGYGGFTYSAPQTSLENNSNWRPPLAEIIREQGGFKDPSGVWITAADFFAGEAPLPESKKWIAPTDWLPPTDEVIKWDGGFRGPDGEWITSNEFFGGTSNSKNLNQEALPSGWTPPSPEKIRLQGGFTDPSGKWITQEEYFGDPASAGWSPPPVDVIRKDGGFRDPNGRWVTANEYLENREVNLGLIPSDDEIRNKGGFFNADGNWISAQQHLGSSSSDNNQIFGWVPPNDDEIMNEGGFWDPFGAWITSEEYKQADWIPNQNDKNSHQNWKRPDQAQVDKDGGYWDANDIWITEAKFFDDPNSNLDWSSPPDEVIKRDGGFLNENGKWISSHIYFGGTLSLNEITKSFDERETKATEGQIEDWNRTGQIPDGWLPDGNGGYIFPSQDSNTPIPGYWVNAASNESANALEGVNGLIGWQPPSDEVIKIDGGFTDPRGVWISSAIHFGEIDPDPNWRLPSEEEIRANGGFHDALGLWINSEIHFLEPTQALVQNLQASEGQIEDWNRTGQIPDGWLPDENGGYIFNPSLITEKNSSEPSKDNDPFSKELYPWKLEEIYENPLTKAKIVLDNPPPELPKKGSIEYELLFQETGGASAVPGFNYEEHIAHTRTKNDLPEWLDKSIINEAANSKDLLTDLKPKDHWSAMIKSKNDSHDKLEGGESSDNIYGGLGSDFIDGGDGIDVAFYIGEFDQYKFDRGLDSVKIEDQRNGLNDGSDTLKNIEYIQFADKRVEIDKIDVVKTYNKNSDDYMFYRRQDGQIEIKTEYGFDEITGIPKLEFQDKEICAITEIEKTFDQVTGKEDTTGKMFRVYNAAFARFPDSDGLSYWIEQNSSGANSDRQVAESFLASDEFKKKYGDNISNEEYVNNLYKNILGRDADSEGLNYWVGQLENGIESRSEALLGFAESAENKLIFSEVTGII